MFARECSAYINVPHNGVLMTCQTLCHEKYAEISIYYNNILSGE